MLVLIHVALALLLAMVMYWPLALVSHLFPRSRRPLLHEKDWIFTDSYKLYILVFSVTNDIGPLGQDNFPRCQCLTVVGE